MNEQAVRVYSRDEVRSLRIRARRAAGSVMTGETMTRARSLQGMEYSDFREYVPGDDVGRIDWNVTARLGKPWVRLYLEERGQPVLLLVDVSASTRYRRDGESPRAVIRDLAARLASAAVWDGYDTGLLLFTDRVRLHVPAGAGLLHLSHLVRELRRTATDGGETSVARALDYLRDTQRRRALIFVVSDFWCSDFTSSLLGCARRHEIVAIGVDEPEDAEMPDCGLMNVRDPETGRFEQLDTSSPEVRGAFSEMIRVRRERNSASFRKAGVDFLQLRAEPAHMDAVAAFLQQRKP